MTKKERVRAIIGLIIIGLIALVLKSLPKPESVPTVVSQPSVEVSEAVTITPKEISDRTSTYDVSVQYPQFQLLSTAATTRINTDVVNMVEDTIDRFTASATQSPLREDLESTLAAEYDTYVSDEMVSVVLSISEYIAGAAHPNDYVLTRVYRQADGSTVSITDVTALPLLAERVRVHLPADQGIDQSSEGLEPRVENFSQFVVTNEAVVVIFNPYQIAPYAAGVISVSIPRSEL